MDVFVSRGSNIQLNSVYKKVSFFILLRGKIFWRGPSEIVKFCNESFTPESLRDTDIYGYNDLFFVMEVHCFFGEVLIKRI